ncbi:MAG: N-formylglutamate amidohydrolase [Rhodospirillaceae bacterium]
MIRIHDCVEPIEIIEPEYLTSPIIVASPHSGDHYPSDLMNASILNKESLRRSEDCYVDDLFSAAGSHRIPFIRAIYARAYLDLNREPFELDPDMFSTPLPDYCNTSSARVAVGLGTIPRIVANRKEIYSRKLDFEEAEMRISSIYKPYHKALRSLVNRTRHYFGYCILLDCHSMPSLGLPSSSYDSKKTINIVLGDLNGLSCSPAITDETDRIFQSLGYSLGRNNPYSGGFTTQHYGDPANGVHAIQIELNRNIYMNESSLSRRPGFTKLKADIGQLLEQLTQFSIHSRNELSFQRLSAE